MLDRVSGGDEPAIKVAIIYKISNQSASFLLKCAHSVRLKDYTIYDIFDDNTFESENDENLNRKFDYNDQAIKHFYHQVCKLPSNKKYS